MGPRFERVKNRNHRGPTREAQTRAADQIARITSALPDGAVRVKWSRLGVDDRSELVGLVDRATRATTGEGFSLAALDQEELARFEHLAERASDRFGLFASTRADTKRAAGFAELRRRAARPPRRVRYDEPGSFRVPQEVFRALDRPAPAYWLQHLGLLTFLALQFENGAALSPGSRLEGAGDDAVLVLDRRLGLGARYDQEGRLGGWQKDLAHLAANGWVDLTTRGQLLHVKRGWRMLRGVNGGAKR